MACCSGPLSIHSLRVCPTYWVAGGLPRALRELPRFCFSCSSCWRECLYSSVAAPFSERRESRDEMRIALVSTGAVAVPARAYGGSELVVAEVGKMLTHLGHEVVVFASGDSKPAAELRAHFAEPVWPPNDLAELRHSAFAWRSVCVENPPFDVVHAHQASAISFSAVCSTPTVLTLHHHRVDELIDFYLDFPDVTHVAISRRQAQLVPELGVRHVVHHGLDADLYEAGNGAGNWLAFVGRFAPEKAPHLAIDAALEVGIPLRLGGQPHWNNDEYFAREVQPRLRRAGRLDRWDGEAAFKPKLAILGVPPA